MEDPLLINACKNANTFEETLINLEKPSSGDDDSMDSYPFGTIYLVRHEFYLKFCCEFCGKQYGNLKDFIRDSLKHIMEETWEMNSTVLLERALDSKSKEESIPDDEYCSFAQEEIPSPEMSLSQLDETNETTFIDEIFIKEEPIASSSDNENELGDTSEQDMELKKLKRSPSGLDYEYASAKKLCNNGRLNSKSHFKHFLIQTGCDEYVPGELECGTELCQPSPLCKEVFEQKKKMPKERVTNFFEVTVPHYTDDQFMEYFGMNRETFQNLLGAVQNNLRNSAQPHVDVPMEKKLLFSLWLIGKQESYLAVGDRFNIPKSSGHNIFRFVVYQICELMSTYIKWPNASRKTNTEISFQNRSGLSGVVGTIDSCHIPIKEPIENDEDFYNEKQFHSIILQGVCDASGQFIDVFVGMPGRMHKAQVFKNSPLYKRLSCAENPLLSEEQHIIGDSAYPLMLNLMTPFRDNVPLEENQILYNMRMNKIRSVIQGVFGRLKGKFCRLKYLDISNIRFGVHIITAACVLQNFILQNQHDENWFEGFGEELGVSSTEEDDENYEEDADERVQEKQNNLMNMLF